MKLDIKEIMSLIPQRYPFLFVDRVEELVPGERIVALKNISVNEPVFTGHFPNNPILPGVIIVEALAQTSGILAAKSILDMSAGVPYLASIDGFRFREPVVPGDTVKLESTVKKHLKNFIAFTCKASVNGKVVAEGEILTALVKESR